MPSDIKLVLYALTLASLMLVPGIPAWADTSSTEHTITLESELDSWRMRSYWSTGQATLDPERPEQLLISNTSEEPLQLINAQSGTDIYTQEQYSDCIVELEVMIPQGGNSGIFLMGQYELQVKDSFGKSWLINSKDMGGLVGRSKPTHNAAKPAGEWQHYVIEFKAPRFEGDKRISPAEFVKVSLNGQIVQQAITMESGPTPGALKPQREFAVGPLMLQGINGAVAYRNIKITPAHQIQ